MTSILKNKTFEVPTCPICMEELTDNLASISCGHVFHTLCIAQSLEFKGACPNCRKRATPKEIRDMMYVVQVTAVDDTNRIQFLESLKQADQENYLKLIAENEEMYKELKMKTHKIAEYKEDVEHKENLLASQGEMIRALSNLKNEWKTEKQALVLQNEAVELENDKIIKNNREMEKRLNNLERDVKDYDRLKKIVESAHDNEDEYLKSLRERSSAQEQAKTFYEFLRIKKGELKKAKDEVQRLNAELGRHKEKIQFLESAAKQKPPMEKRKDINDIPRRATMDNNRIIPETTISKPHKPSTSRFDPDVPNFSMSANFQPEMDFGVLQKDFSNTSVKERTAQLQQLVKKPVELVRPMRSLIYPPGMTKTSVEEMGGMNRSQLPIMSDTTNIAFRSSVGDLNRSKQSDFSSTKKVKLSDMDLGLQANVQKKIFSFVNQNK